jgi:hypothetical protein
MYLRKVDFDVVVAYIDGLDAASHNCLLLGFREWLIPRLDDGSNLIWSEIVLYLAFPGVADPRAQLQEEDDHTKAIESLFGHLDAYWSEKSRPNGMRAIYLRFQAWLEEQEWYSPQFPDWIDTRGRYEGTDGTNKEATP